MKITPFLVIYKKNDTYLFYPYKKTYIMKGVKKE